MTNTQKLLINAVCKIRNCEISARWNLETKGHPNGDAAAAYCTDHVLEIQPLWDESPKVYSVVITGPFEGKK